MILVTDELLEEFKERNHISHSSEDGNLKKLLAFSVAFVKSKCGEFEVNGDSDANKLAKELVLERTRYAYNEALEYFEDNFLSDIFSLGIALAGDELESE